MKTIQSLDRRHCANLVKYQSALLAEYVLTCQVPGVQPMCVIGSCNWIRCSLQLDERRWDTKSCKPSCSRIVRDSSSLAVTSRSFFKLSELCVITQLCQQKTKLSMLRTGVSVGSFRGVVPKHPKRFEVIHTDTEFHRSSDKGDRPYAQAT